VSKNMCTLHVGLTVLYMTSVQTQSNGRFAIFPWTFTVVSAPSGNLGSSFKCLHQSLNVKMSLGLSSVQPSYIRSASDISERSDPAVWKIISYSAKCFLKHSVWVSVYMRSLNCLNDSNILPLFFAGLCRLWNRK